MSRVNWSYEDGTYVSNDVTAEEAKRFVNVATCPKCGTNLLIKIFQEFGINYKFLRPRRPHLFHHVKFRPTKRRSYVDLDKGIKRDEIYVGTVRDPRDFFVSYINWIDRINGEAGRKANDAWRSESFETKLSWAINETTPTEFQELTKWPWHTDQLYYAAELLKMKLSNFLVVRFEELLGPELGGPSRDAQRKAIEKIRQFTGAAPATDQKVDEVIRNLKGNTATYREGKKVGQWKDHYTPQLVDDFKGKHNSLLMDLGYETGPDWNLPSPDNSRRSMISLFRSFVSRHTSPHPGVGA